MLIARNSYDVAIWAYFGQGGLENSEVAHLTHHIAGETLRVIYRVIKRKNKCRKHNRKHNMQEGDGEKVTVENEGVTREVLVTGGKMKGRKEVSVDVSNRKSITGMMTGTKDDSQGGVHSSNKKSAKNSLENCIKFDYKCVCLNARSILHK